MEEYNSSRLLYETKDFLKKEEYLRFKVINELKIGVINSHNFCIKFNSGWRLSLTTETNELYFIPESPCDIKINKGSLEVISSNLELRKDLFPWETIESFLLTLVSVVNTIELDKKGFKYTKDYKNLYDNYSDYIKTIKIDSIIPDLTEISRSDSFYVSKKILEVYV